MPLSTEVLENAQLLEEAVWSFLSRACHDVKHAFRLCMLATVDEKHLPKNRVVVLRSCDTRQKLLSFHSDIRSGKIAQLRQNPAVSMLFWDSRHSLQVRVEGLAVIHHANAVTTEKLAKLPPHQFALYGHATAPGVSVDPFHQGQFQEELVAANFAWIDVQALNMDVLHLGRTGKHTRCSIEYLPSNQANAFFVKA